MNSGADFKPAAPKTLFQTRVDREPFSRYHYAVSADGQRFLLNSPVEDAASSPINVVINWTADLKR